MIIDRNAVTQEVPIDPETGKPAFTGADLLDCSMSVWKGLIMFLGAVNRGEFEQKKS